MKKKVILSSVLSLAMCSSIAVGATFALFTSDSQTNITVSSGTVKVTSTVSDLEMYSHEAINMTTFEGTKVDRTEARTFLTGGTADYDEEKAVLTLDKLVPGDGVTFKISVTNESDVAIKYRTVISDPEGSNFLMNELAVTIRDAKYYGAATTEWTSLEAGNAIDSIPVSIELPTSAGDAYQGLEVALSIKVEAVQGNATATAATVNGVAYESVEEAIAKAQSGETVEVVEGTIAKMPATVADGVTVKGATFNTPVEVTAATAATIAEGDEVTATTADPVTFDSCTFKGNAILSVVDRNVALTNCTFVDTVAGTCADGDMPYVYQKSGEATVTVDENTKAEVVVYTVAEWVDMAKVLNSLDQSYLTVKLGADLDLTGVTDYKINTLATTLDGQEYTISNLNGNLFGTVNGTVSNLNVKNVTVLNTSKGGANGFIGTLAEDGLVDNCKVSNVDVKWADGISDMTDGFGGVISTVKANATVQNCEFTDISVTTYAKTKRTGGVFDGISGTVKGCVVDGVNFTVVDDDGKKAYITSYGGGFAAIVNGGAVVEDCIIKNMNVTADYAQNGGGIFGKAFVEKQTSNITLKNITVEGLNATIGTMKFTGGAYTNFGGFIGQVDSRSNAISLNVDNCHITGLDMTLASVSTSESPAAGFISCINGNANITNCSVAGKIDGTNDPFAIGGFLGDIGGHGCPADGYVVNVSNSSADVVITGNDNIFVGGFVGYAGSYRKTITLTLTFTNCEATGSFYGQLETGTNETSVFTGCKVDGVAFNG